MISINIKIYFSVLKPTSDWPENISLNFLPETLLLTTPDCQKKKQLDKNDYKISVVLIKMQSS